MKYGWEVGGNIEAKDIKEAIKKVKDKLEEILSIADEDFEEVVLIWEEEELREFYGGE